MRIVSRETIGRVSALEYEDVDEVCDDFEPDETYQVEDGEDEENDDLQ